MAEAPQIVVIDDTADVCMLLQNLLRDEGYRAECYQDGAAGLARVLTGGVQLVLLDWKLPHLHGAELLPQIAASAGAPAVVIFTAAGQRELSDVPPGAVAVLRKPFEIDELLALVARYCPPIFP
jgi:two-component system, OmpR family, response regulator